MSTTTEPRRSLEQSPVEQLQKTLRQVFIQMLDQMKVVESQVVKKHFKMAENGVRGFRIYLERCVEILYQPLGQDVKLR